MTYDIKFSHVMAALEYTIRNNPGNAGYVRPCRHLRWYLAHLCDTYASHPKQKLSTKACQTWWYTTEKYPISLQDAT